jgi:NTE family protein
MKTRLAIACQGGGSQTAFTAGVIKALCENRNRLRNHFDVVSVSGTSGGALCAFFLWYAFKKGDDCLWKRLIDFWEDNTAQTFHERFFNDSIIKTLKSINAGSIPQYNLSPSSPLVKTLFSLSTQGLRPQFTDFRALLEAHVDFSEVEAWGAQSKPPIVILGACNILTGRLHKFSSYLEPIRIEHILASACIPNVFPAVTIDVMAYWDGLFSDNPPIQAVIRRDTVGVDNIAQEIWVIKINPTTCNTIPEEPNHIVDRRNQLEGNVSLFQGLCEIEDINRMISMGAFTKKFLSKVDIKEPIRIPKSFPEDPDQPWHIPMIEISEELQNTLVYEDKLDRSPENIHRLIREGEKQGQKFIEARFKQLGKPIKSKTK